MVKIGKSVCSVGWFVGLFVSLFVSLCLFKKRVFYGSNGKKADAGNPLYDIIFYKKHVFYGADAKYRKVEHSTLRHYLFHKACVLWCRRKIS